MRKAVYFIIFLTSLLLLEIVSSGNAVSECAAVCNAECDHDDKACFYKQINCVRNRQCPQQQNECKPFCSRECNGDHNCQHMKISCAWKQLCEACNQQCDKCIDPDHPMPLPKCRGIGIKFCGGRCPHPHIHKPGLVQRGMSDLFDFDGDETDQIPGVEPVHSTDGLMVIAISKPALYGIVAVVILLLVSNISCLFYVNCIKQNGRKKIKYSKVDVVGSSDDDMENLKRVEI